MTSAETEQSTEPPRRALIRVAAVIAPVIAVLALLAWVSLRNAPRDVGERAASFDLERLDGRGRVSSDDFAGRSYVLNFWASWCVPCREEAPVLAEVAGTGEGEPAFVGVNILDGIGEARDFVEEFRVRYPNVRDAGGVFRRFRVAGIPETIFVDRDGTIAGRYVGAIDESTLRRLLADLKELGRGETLRISGSGPSVGVR